MFNKLNKKLCRSQGHGHYKENCVKVREIKSINKNWNQVSRDKNYTVVGGFIS